MGGLENSNRRKPGIKEGLLAASLIAGAAAESTPATNVGAGKESDAAIIAQLDKSRQMVAEGTQTLNKINDTLSWTIADSGLQKKDAPSVKDQEIIDTLKKSRDAVEEGMKTLDRTKGNVEGAEQDLDSLKRGLEQKKANK